MMKKLQNYSAPNVELIQEDLSGVLCTSVEATVDGFSGITDYEWE